MILGELYVFDADNEFEWLAVRYHPDDSNLVLLAPVDECSLVGPPDVAIDSKIVGRDLTVRCGHTDWFPVNIRVPFHRTDSLPDSELKRVRKCLADLARGRISTEEVSEEYDVWMAGVVSARESFLNLVCKNERQDYEHDQLDA